MQNLPRPKAIFFDWDGTIVNSMPNIFAAMCKTQEVFGQPTISHEQFAEIVRLGPQPDAFFRDHLGYEEIHVASAADFFNKHVTELRAGPVNLMHNIESFLYEASQNKIPMGVVSNMNHESLCEEVERLGWNKYFNAIAGGGRAERNKPHPDPIYLVAEELGLSREDLPQTWFVGDMDADRQAAKAAGCAFVFYSNGTKQLECAAEITDYADLKNHLIRTCEMV